MYFRLRASRERVSGRSDMFWVNQGQRERGSETRKEKTYNGMYIQQLTITNNLSAWAVCLVACIYDYPHGQAEETFNTFWEKRLGKKSSMRFFLPGIHQAPGLTSSHVTLPHGCYGWFSPAQAVRFIPKRFFFFFLQHDGLRFFFTDYFWVHHQSWSRSPIQLLNSWK